MCRFLEHSAGDYTALWRRGWWRRLQLQQQLGGQQLRSAALCGQQAAPGEAEWRSRGGGSSVSRGWAGSQAMVAWRAEELGMAQRRSLHYK